jgi:alcohol dehydrogenase class IV
MADGSDPGLDLPADPFVQDYRPGAIHYGRGCVADLGTALADRGLDDALVVTGRNVGANRDVMGPVEAGLGDRLAETFAETTPEKDVGTAVDVTERLREVGADALVAVGSGSSLDLARYARLLADDDRQAAELRGVVTAGETPAVPEAGLPPLFVVPTTFAGASMSVVAAATYGDGGERRSTAVVDEALMPTGLFYDPDLFETTPPDVLAGSAMNGFDKAVECLYASNGTPVTDATAVRALSYLGESLPRLRSADDPAVTERATVGIVLAQYGVSWPGAYKLGLIHAFGHGLRTTFGIQQGVAHAVVAPHALRLLFDRVDGRRALLAAGLGVAADDPDASAEAVIDVVVDVRDGLGLPARLRDLDGTDEGDLRRVAERTREDGFMANLPEGFDPSIADLESVLRDAW